MLKTKLPPIIKSLNSKTIIKSKDVEGLIKGMTLETTLFDRLLKLHGASIKRMLTTQYRMHEKIMRFPSDELYESKLIAADFVKERLLKDLPYEVKETEDTVESLVFWDTQGGDFPEKSEEEEVGKKAGKGLMGESKSNEMEAALVEKQVRDLIDAGVRAEDIAVVTPYNAQVSSILFLKSGLNFSSLFGHAPWWTNKVVQHWVDFKNLFLAALALATVSYHGSHWGDCHISFSR